MGKERKKGESGANANYISRSRAVRRLQISLPQFRKLCILKGIYPRAPPKQIKSKEKTYYLAKDINFLAHDPILPKFRQFKTWRKKVAKAKGRNEDTTIKRLQRHKPKYKLDHIIRERYPRFQDALLELNDALSLMFLYAEFPPERRLTKGRLRRIRLACLSFLAWVKHERAIRKVFVSIKGIYFQLEVQNQEITFIMPHQFPQTVPYDVDERVLLSFLEFYETLLGFVNFKLYHDSGLHFPPKIDKDQEIAGAHVGSVILSAPLTITADEVESDGEDDEYFNNSNSNSNQQEESEKRIASLQDKMASIHEEEGDDVVDDNDGDDDEEDNFEEEEKAFTDVVHKRDEELIKFKNLFNGLHFFLNREVPHKPLELLIESFGGKVTWQTDRHLEEGINAELDSTITHQLVDRPVPNKIKSREYVQPQWIFDSVNSRFLLPTAEYSPDVDSLPPHLSPFVNDQAEGYIPERLEEIRAMKNRVLHNSSMEDDGDSDDDDDDDDDIDSDDEDEDNVTEKLEEFENELENEAKGISYSQLQQQQQKRKSKKRKRNDDYDDDEDDDEEDDEDDEIVESKSARRKRLQKEKKQKEEEEQKRMQAIMIPNKKKKRLYQRIQYSKNQKKMAGDTLLAKRKAIQLEEKQNQNQQQKRNVKKRRKNL